MHQEFGMLLNQISERKKKASESYGQYYKDKLEMCHRLKFNNAQTVSCIISKMPEEVRSQALILSCGESDEL